MYVSTLYTERAAGYHAVMVGYRKGTDVAAELAKIRESIALIGAAMQSDPDVVQAFTDATQLIELGQMITREASEFRGWFAAEAVDVRQILQADLARMLGLTPGRIGQLVRAGRQKRGNPMSDPGTMPELAPVAVAIVTSDKGVLIAHRTDGRPEWTFPGGEILTGESPADAVIRRVPAETAVTIKPTLVFGRRVHPRTNRLMIYMACRPDDDTVIPRVVDDADLDAAEYVGLDTVRERMPDMYEPVRAHLEAELGNRQQF